MKSFAEWLVENKKEINEISSDLLYRAASAAEGRPDARGERLANKFQTAGQNKEDQARRAADEADEQKIDSHPDKVFVDLGSMGKFHLILTQGHGNAHEMNGKDSRPFFNLAFKAKEEPGPQGRRSGVLNGMLRLEKSNEMSPVYDVYFTMYHRGVPNVSSWEGRTSDPQVRGLDRKSAMIITKFINSHGGNVKPTELPLR